MRSGLLYLLPVVGANLLPFITLPIFTRLLRPEDFGYLALATVYATIVTGLAQLGLMQGFEREFFARQNRDGGVGLLYSVLVFVCATLVVIGLLTWVLRGQVTRTLLRLPSGEALVLVTFAALGVQALRQYVLTFFRNQLQAGSFAFFSVGEAVLSAMFALVFVGAARLGVAGIPLGQLAAGLVVLGVMLARVNRVAPPRLDGPAFREALRIGAPLTPRVLLSAASTQFDKYMLGLLATVSGVGIYSIGQRLAYGVFSYMTALENVFVPRTLATMFGGEEKGGERIGQYLTSFAYLSVAVALAVSLFGEELLRLLTPPEYAAATPIISILAVYYATFFFSKQRQLIVARKTHLVTVLSVATLALNVLLNIPLIRLWGAFGAAMGTCLAGALSVWLTVTVSQRYYRIHYEVRPLVAIYGSLVVATIVVLFLRESAVAYPLRLGVKLFLLSWFLFLGNRLGVLNRNSVSTVMRALRSRFATA